MTLQLFKLKVLLFSEALELFTLLHFVLQLSLGLMFLSPLFFKLLLELSFKDIPILNGPLILFSLEFEL